MTNLIRIGCIVEGHGDEQAVPVLIRRVLERYRPDLRVEVPRPFRISRGKLLKEMELERAIELVARRVAPLGAVLVLFDADDDCPVDLGPKLLARARERRKDVPMRVVLANREFESWFLAGARSLQGVRAQNDPMQPPANPEAVRNAKQWLSVRRTDGHSYSETLDQVALAARLSLDEARSAPSFDKLVRDVLALADEVLALARKADSPA